MSEDLSSIPKWKAWVISARPKTLVAVLGPLIISFFYLAEAVGHTSTPPFPWGRIAMVWLGCFLLQIACNLTNDYFDYVRGTDDENRLGPKRMLQQGIISKEVMAKGLFLLYSSFFFIAMWFSLILTWKILFLAVMSMLAAFYYTGGRYPLSYHGLGDLFAFWFFGPLLTLIIIYVTGYGIIDFDPFTAVILGLGPGFFSLSLLNINNIRDMEQDRNKGKKTAAQFWGRKRSLYLLAIFFGICMLLPSLIGIYYRKEGSPLLLIFLLPALLFTRKVFIAEGSEFNSLIGFAAGFYLLETVLFSLIWFF